MSSIEKPNQEFTTLESIPHNTFFTAKEIPNIYYKQGGIIYLVIYYESYNNNKLRAITNLEDLLGQKIFSIIKAPTNYFSSNYFAEKEQRSNEIIF